MKVAIVFASTLLAVATSVQAGNVQRSPHVPPSVPDEKASVDSVTPAPAMSASTSANIPTPAPTQGATYTPRLFPNRPQPELPTGTSGGKHSTETAVGVAYATTRSSYEAEKHAGNGSATVPVLVVGCCVGVIGAVAAAMAISKRKAAVAETENEMEPEYSNAMHTPVASDKRSYSSLLESPAAVIHDVDYIGDIDDMDSHVV
uniref:Mid2 domain-containing protein n=1 Tax=Peronospora matthiolae TaxID=2874970 RepID=A0AAV1T5I7_9STRA